MVRWHHRRNGHEFEQTLGDSEGQGSLVWGCSLVQSMGLQQVLHDWVTEKDLAPPAWLRPECPSLITRQP